MKAVLFGKKLGQSQTFDEKGERVPITRIDVNHCYIVRLSWQEEKSCLEMLLGCFQTKNIKKSVKGQLEKAGIKTPLRFLRTAKWQKGDNGFQYFEEEGKKGIAVGEQKLFVGDMISPSLFLKPGDMVAVTGTSKGKGFQGVVKRHGFKGGPRTHGQSDRERAPGSIGQTTTPGRVYKGKRMAGRMGGDTVTIKGLKVIGIKDAVISVKGLVPGSKNGLLRIVG